MGENRGKLSSTLHCPNTACQKPILSGVALAEGSTFVLRCPGCSVYVRIQAGFNFIHKRVLTEPRERRIVETEA